MTQRKLEVGEVVMWISPTRTEHKALVTAIWGDPEGRVMMPRLTAEGKARRERGELSQHGDWEQNSEGHCIYDPVSEPGTKFPGINLVLVMTDEKNRDQYGRQIERQTSVEHQAQSTAKGRCWRFPDEPSEAPMQPPVVA